MSLKVLLQDHSQRSIALVTATHALVFRNNSPSASQSLTSKATTPRCIVEFAALEDVDLSDHKSIRLLGVYGTLGLINVNNDVFLCVITAASSVATVRPGETVQRIASVEFYCLTRNDYDRELFEESHQYNISDASSDAFDYEQVMEHRDGTLEHPCLALRKMLSSGTFYYSADFDLTNRLQNRTSEEPAFDIDNFDDGFLWNSYLIEPLIKFRSRLAAADRELLDGSHILTSAIRGYVATMIIPASSSPLKNLQTNLPSNLTLISRLSCRRAGTRFNARGIDDDGNVANFVETETVYWFPSGLCFSYAQVRGSVPVFWEQATGILPHQQKIQITRSPEATEPAFNKHFEDLELKYGTVHILNLLSESKSGEIELTERYNHHIRMSPLNQTYGNGEASDHCMLQGTQFDFHAETKGPGGYEAASSVRRLIQGYAEGFVYYLSDNVEEINPRTKARTKRSIVVLQQEGVFRTNCLDCLDRTNLIQTIISQMALESFLRHRGEHALADFWMRHSTLWADNGDALSKIYAGTGALKSSFTRHGKMSLAGAIADARKSATRLYINNFTDKARQNTTDILLGRLVDQFPVQLYDPINDYVTAELNKRAAEYSTSEVINLWVGTFNLNGKTKGTKEDLSLWLCPEINQAQQSPEIMVIGFQEIVELSPQQIMSTDPVRRHEWEIAVTRTLNENARKQKSEDYVMLRSGQLVGAALMVFAKTSVLKYVKNVEGAVKKTGLSGMAGNKGAVAVRMDFANTGLCFITAHLAAGFANYDERNRDYRTISHGLRFQRNRSIDDHDTIIWLGDFNYRIGLTDEKVRRLIDAGDLEALYRNDQLHLQMVAGNTFPYYSEARITFLPTYKYNNGTDEYDTSEKARIPAWCDRILRKGENLRQIQYNTAPLRFSDHRPVYATFECTVGIINEPLKESLSRELYNKRRTELGTGASGMAVTTGGVRPSSEFEEDELAGYESIAPGLPAASSGRKKWWLNNGLPARSTLPETKARDGFIPNPARPSNPFAPSSEPDWVLVDERPSLSPPACSHTRPPSPPQPPRFRSISTSTPTHMKSHELELSKEKSASPSALTRTQSYASSVSSSPSRVIRKPAPPVPRKPAELASNNPLGSSSGDSAITPRSPYPPASTPNPPAHVLRRRSEAPSASSRRDGLGAPQGAGTERKETLGRVEMGRRSTQAHALVAKSEPPVRSEPATGLMDESFAEAGSIPALVPRRKG